MALDMITMLVVIVVGLAIAFVVDWLLVWTIVEWEGGGRGR